MLEVYTAVPRETKFDLEEPLIDNVPILIISSQDDTTTCDNNNTSVLNKTTTRRRLFSPVRFAGFLLGFGFQANSLIATALLAKYYGDRNISLLNSYQEKAVYVVLLAMSSQLWLLLFPITVALAMERSWTERGTQYLCEYYQYYYNYHNYHNSYLNQREEKQRTFLYTKNFNNNNNITQDTQRNIFTLGVQFLIGIVLGSFLTWALIDLYLGASLHMFVVLFGSMIACIVLCHALIIVYDTVSSYERKIYENDRQKVEW